MKKIISVNSIIIIVKPLKKKCEGKVVLPKNYFSLKPGTISNT